MKEYIKKGLIGVVSTLLIIILLMIIFGPKAIVELVSVKIENEKYFNTILVKNLQDSEYLKNIEFIIDSDIKTELLSINGKVVDNNKIILNKQKPRNVTTINFVTNKKINKNNLDLINNSQKINFNYFNDRKKLNLQLIITIIICVIVNIFISIYFNSKSKKKTQDEKEIVVSQEIVYTDEIVDLDDRNSYYQRILW